MSDGRKAWAEDVAAQECTLLWQRVTRALNKGVVLPNLERMRRTLNQLLEDDSMPHKTYAEIEHLSKMLNAIMDPK